MRITNSKKLILFLTCLTFFYLAEKEKFKLFPFEDDNGKWGYINKEGKFIIEPKFYFAYGFF